VCWHSHWCCADTACSLFHSLAFMLVWHVCHLTGRAGVAYLSVDLFVLVVLGARVVSVCLISVGMVLMLVWHIRHLTCWHCVGMASGWRHITISTTVKLDVSNRF
jgi:hypothetical protein